MCMGMTHLRAFDVVVKVISKGVDQINGVISCFSVFKMTWKQH